MKNFLNNKTLFLCLTILAGIAALWPLMDFQYFLAQGDHGRDLYCFQKVMEGQVPYRDFSWLFGPLMPYYYGVFGVLLGPTVQTVLLAQNILTLTTGVLIYLCAVTVGMAPPLSLIGALFYWAFRGGEFFYTYNHSGAMALILLVLLFTLRYLHDPQRYRAYGGFAAILAVMFIRLNMGVALLLGYLFILCWTDFVKQSPLRKKENRKVYTAISLGVLLVTALVYWMLLHDLPDYAIRQSMPYSSSQRTDRTADPLTAVHILVSMLQDPFRRNVLNQFLLIGFLLCLVELIRTLGSHRTSHEKRTRILLILAALFIFQILLVHEYMASGVGYRLSWALPVNILIILYIIHTASERTSSLFIKFAAFLVLLYIALHSIHRNHTFINRHKTQGHLIAIGANRLYTTQGPAWIPTVTEAVRYLNAHLAPGEQFFALPFDPLYYFLAQRDSPTRQLIFFDHFNIPEEQERGVIRDLGEKNVKWIILSSRCDTTEPGMGTLGKTYCPLIWKYIEEHFVLAAEIGDWSQPSDWATHHAVRIYKRGR